MEDKFFWRITDRDKLIVDQWKDNPTIFRISWFEDNHYQCEKWVNLKDEEFDRPMPMFDWYLAGYGLYVDLYFIYNNKYISFDYDCNGEYIYRTYSLQELFDNATITKQKVTFDRKTGLPNEVLVYDDQDTLITSSLI